MTNDYRQYSTQYFVDRKEVVSINKFIDVIRANPKAEKRVVNIWGGRGSGKSWVLHYLQETLNAKGDLRTYYLNLSDFGKKDPLISVLEIIDGFADEMRLKQGGKIKFGPTPSEASRKLIEAIRSELKKKPLVLLVDHVYESNWDLLANLEEYWLGPLAVESGTFIIMAGRRREYPWKTPELRLRALSIDLKPFNDDQLKQQLEKFDLEPGTRKDLLKTSLGNPLANIVFASKNKKDALEELIDTSLSIAPLAKDKKIAREYLEAVSVLKAFDEDRIKVMLATYYDDASYKDWTYVRARQACSLLVDSSLAHWDEQKGGFVIDPDLQVFVREYLSTEKKDVWKKLNQAAIKLYKEWTTAYKQAEKQWKGEIKYHEALIKT